MKHEDVDPELLKRCGRCKERLPISAFYRNRARTDGLATWCKECHDENTAATYRARKDAILEKYGRKCAKCGSIDERILQIDHVNGGGVHEVRGLANPGVYHKKIMDDQSGSYQLLCPSCNWSKRVEQGEAFRRHIPKRTHDSFPLGDISPLGTNSKKFIASISLEEKKALQAIEEANYKLLGGSRKALRLARKAEWEALSPAERAVRLAHLDPSILQKRGGSKIYPQLNDEAWLREHYIDKQMNYEDMALLIGITNGAKTLIAKAIKMHKIPKRTMQEAIAISPRRAKSVASRRISKYPELNDEAWLREQYIAKQLSSYDIAALIGERSKTTAKAVIKAIDRLNIPKRTAQEVMALAPKTRKKRSTKPKPSENTMNQTGPPLPPQIPLF